MPIDLGDFLKRARVELDEVGQGKNPFRAVSDLVSEEVNNGDVLKGAQAVLNKLADHPKNEGVVHLESSNGNFQKTFKGFSDELASSSHSTDKSVSVTNFKDSKTAVTAARLESAAGDLEGLRGHLNVIRNQLREVQTERPVLEDALKRIQHEYPAESAHIGALHDELDGFYSSADRLDALSGRLEEGNRVLTEAQNIEAKTPIGKFRSLSPPELFSTDAWKGLMGDVANEALQVLQLLGQMYVLDPVMHAATNGKPGIHVEWDVIKSGLGGITSDVAVDAENLQPGSAIPVGLANAYHADRMGTQWLFSVMVNLVHKHGPGGDDPLLLEELPGGRGEQYRGTGAHLFAKMELTDKGLQERPLDLKNLDDQGQLLEIVSKYLGEDIMSTSTAFGVFKKYIFDPRLENYNEQVDAIKAHLSTLNMISERATHIELEAAYFDLKTIFSSQTQDYINKQDAIGSELAKMKANAATETYKDILRHSDELNSEIFEYYDHFDTLLDLKEFLAVSKGGPTSKPKPEHLNIQLANSFAHEFLDFIDQEVQDKNSYVQYIEMLKDDKSNYVPTILSHISDFNILI